MGDLGDQHDVFSNYVQQLGGARLIRKILVANNGIAAVKAIRSIRRWSYETFGNERTVQFVAMATPEDVRANAEYIRMADIWVDVPGGSNNHNFANVHLIADIAERYRCHAVWAGWGHASENPALPSALAAINVVFLGPDPRSMHALGDKIASTIIAQSAGVPTAPWSGTGITCNYSQHKSVPNELYRKACVTSPEQAQLIADECGYPVVVKASEGGGGKGIRVVLDPTSLTTAFRQVAGEVPGSPIFLMRLVRNSRHLEVQLVADETGDAIALYGRDCSVQRRHQKIIEEGPVVAAPSHVWKKLEAAAVALAKEVRYVGAGTVEYLYTGNTEGGEFFFLELNPRLQVEHPVTEWITGVDLPALQLHIGMGIPLKNVPSIRKFFKMAEYVEAVAPNSSSIRAQTLDMPFTIAQHSMESGAQLTNEDWAHRCPRPPHGHVIACRVTAENPDEGFQPTSGDIQELTFRNTPNVWGYFSVGASGGVHEFADSQFGHLFAWGESRESSRRSMVLALKELSIRGDIRTTVEYIIKLLELKEFRENAISTAWLDSLIADHVTAEKPPTELAVVVAAVCRAHSDFSRRADEFTKSLERGQLPSLDLSLVEFPVELIYDDIKYALQITRADVSTYRVRLANYEAIGSANDPSVLVELRCLADGAKLILLNGRSHVCYFRQEPNGLRLSVDGKTCLFPEEYDPTTLRSSVSGKLIRFIVDSGDHVEVGQPYAEMEVMKMYLALTAPESGVITIQKPEGTSVDVGAVVATLELDDPSKVRRAEQFDGQLPAYGPPQTVGSKPHQLFARARKHVRLLLKGFDTDLNAIDTFFELIDEPQVALGQMREALAALAGRIPASVSNQIEDSLAQISVTEIGSPGNEDNSSSYPIFSGSGSGDEETCRRTKFRLMESVSTTASFVCKVTQELPVATELHTLASQYASGSVIAPTVTALLDEYLIIERTFAKRVSGAGDALYELREAHRDDLSALVEIAASHASLKKKNHSLILFLQALLRPNIAIALGEENVQTADFKTKLHQLSQLFAPAYADVALKARLMLADFRRPRFHQRKRVVGQRLGSINSASKLQRRQAIQSLVGLSESILDVLVTFVLPAERGSIPSVVRKVAAEVQVLRSYRAYNVCNLNVEVNDDDSAPLKATWHFRFTKSSRESSQTTFKPRNTSTEHSTSIGLTSFDSADNLSSVQGSAFFENGPFRTGLLVAFSGWQDMEEHFDNTLSNYPVSTDFPPGRDINVLTVLIRWDKIPESIQTNSFDASFGDGRSGHDHLASEEYVSEMLSIFCREDSNRVEMIRKAGVRSVTFIVVPPVGDSTTYPGFYTFKARDCFKEDLIFRHIDPPMAFQLELSRLANFNITRFGYPARTLHVFFAQDKTAGKRRLGTPPVQKMGTQSPNCSIATKSKNLGTNPNGIPKEIPEPTDEIANLRDRQALSLESLFALNVAESKRTALGNESSDLVGATSRADKDVDARFFVRAVIRQADVITRGTGDGVVSIPEAERTFVEALDAVEMASCDRRLRRTDFNHIFLNLIPPVQIDVEDVETICRRIFQRYSARVWSLRVFVVEIKVTLLVSDGTTSATTPLRFLLYNPTGHSLKVESYVETIDPQSGIARVMAVSHDNQGSLHGKPVTAPYPVMDRIQRKRVLAQAMETTYVYDFLHIFTKQLQNRWRSYSQDRLLGSFRRHKITPPFMKSVELVMQVDITTGSTELVETYRASGLNDCGIVVWKCTMSTPEYPTGRDVIIIANDITFKSGSFGPEEDAMFLAASRLARSARIPRIYLAANSGARIGVANEVRDRIQAIWNDPECPSKGVKGLGISSEDLREMSDSVCVSEEIFDNLRKITDVFGAEHGLGVENLMGSGLIAGETSRAYDEIFTLTYVTARSVGIGAYLVRLGQRVIQKESSSPIILTGYSALNKVLGHDVYLSNDQLGGTKIMYPNGITHSVVPDDVAGVGAILDWLSFVPRRKGDSVPVVESRDSVTRPIECHFELGQIVDPRTKLIAGEISSDTGDMLGAFFDKYSWREYLQGWAKTVITGRARLGGVPAGVIAVETRSVDKISPADPASPETYESVVTQAGQVWYPDSAAKTAQAIKDFDREDLPLFIFANWRGFSGGMRDMFDEVLKSGANIVDALRCYSQPVFVYIPRGAELRGGAWVVLDTLINPNAIEMYADTTARGGVLEPEGTVDVKYRRREILKTMHRLDPELKKLDQELQGENTSVVMLSDERKRAIHDEIYKRESEILPVYRSLAVTFCDLHDTPGRMLRKGAIRKIVPWKQARSFFYWRLQRRLAENRVSRMISQADPSLTDEQVSSLLRRWAADYRIESTDGTRGSDGSPLLSSGSILDDDRWVFQWLEVEEDTIERKVARIRASKVSEEVRALAEESRDGFLRGIDKALRGCDNATSRASLVAAIQDKLQRASTSSAPTTTRSILSRFKYVL